MISKNIQYNSKPERSRLFCPLNLSMSELFFSLVDYRNNYFTNNDPNKIIEFYNGFENRDQLIQWMRERPKGVSNIHEVDGDKDIIVVITTADFNGKYARECRDNIFKGLHMIFVESGGRGDFYFNYAHNCNLGIRKAMEYSPKWLIVSNDDMSKIDNVKILMKELLTLPSSVSVAFAPNGEHIVADWQIGRTNLIGTLAQYLIPRKGNLKYYADILRLRKKFEVKYMTLNSKFSFKEWHEFLYRRTNEKFKISGVFNLFRTDYLRQAENETFDETFINGAEDTDLYLKVRRSSTITATIDYKIANLRGRTLGNGRDRNLREICNHAYLNYKISKRKLACKS